MISRKHSLSTGSMADVAFLLLVFFLLVTKIAEDQGIMAFLPSTDAPLSGSIHPRNIIEVSIGASGEILLEGEYADLADLSQQAYLFYTNSGVLEPVEALPDYPFRQDMGSDSLYAARSLAVLKVFNQYRPLPPQAVIQLRSRAHSPYAWYIAVMNALEEGRRRAGNEVLADREMPTWETLEKHARYRAQLQALELLFPARVQDVWE